MESPANPGILVARTPIVQGGMGVRISLSGLAAASANAGGIGVIAAAGMGLLEPGRLQGFPGSQHPGPAPGDPRGPGNSPRASSESTSWSP
ncbi:MAG: nitronate monooxygenase [Bacillus subtilis]|nr:nitronate monooxygenase [Bacillus subtilis]